MLAKLQYISQGATADAHVENITAALEAGCRWIQLRLKNGTTEELQNVSEKVKRLCASFNATFIINDHPHIAKAVDADGVHLGLQDMPVAEARKIIGEGKIIGGTANTFADVVQRYEEGCTYVGVGPFRFTTTKEKLSPILGPEGYASIISRMETEGIQLPLYAIGGITPEDMEALMQTGVYGIAVSGIITHHGNRKQLVEQLNSFLYAAIDNSRQAI